VKAIDVHGFGGGFTLGAVQAGWELEKKVSREVGFGVLNTLANRPLLGENWDSITAATQDWDQLEGGKAQLVFGNPPCSGFSTLSPKAFRGTDSKINDYMWELIRYAGKVGPELVIFESVQQAFTQGIPLMRKLHALLEELAGETYTIYHVLHNNASVGGVSIRKRFFFVCARIPFGVDHHKLDYVPTFGDALRDLEPLGLTMLAQPYRSVTHPCRPEPFTSTETWECKCSERGLITVMNSSRWCRETIHDGTGIVDGHEVCRSPSLDRAQELILAMDGDWPEGDSIGTVLRRHYEKYNKLPPGWDYETQEAVYDDNGEPVMTDNLDRHGNQKPLMRGLPKWQRLRDTNFAMGHNQISRWYWDRPARVVTGGGVHLVLHPHLGRTLTQREVARVQGFPDAWKIWPVRDAGDLGTGWGKGVPVQAGRWIAHWAKRSVEGKPGPLTGVPLAVHNKKLGIKYGEHPREYVVDVTNDYVAILK